MRIDSSTRALVTGASKGIGRATAKALAARGAQVGLVARGAAELEALAAELGANAIPVAGDVSDRNSIATAIEAFAAEAGGLDVLVANAGIAHYAPFADQPIEDAEQMVQVNVLGTIYTVDAALPLMLDRANGHIVVVSSGAGLRAFPWAAVYGATKGAQRRFAEALRHELSGTGVSVTTVFPGEVATDLHAHERERLPDWRSNDDELPPEKLAAAIVDAVESDRREVHVPGLVRVLGLNDLAPRLVDALLRRIRGATAAPRRD
jgi:NADP-dependent 3-hydroxy acid dehydrogenase YdfG